MPTPEEAIIICQMYTGFYNGPEFDACIFEMTKPDNNNPNYGILEPLIISKYGRDIPFFDLSFDINDYRRFCEAMTVFWTLKGGFYTAAVDVSFPLKYLFSHPKSKVKELIFSSNPPVTSDDSIKYFESFKEYFEFVNSL